MRANNAGRNQPRPNGVALAPAPRRSGAGARQATRSVLVVGTGLIGTSLALALREQGVVVFLSDTDETALTLACELGAGTQWLTPRAGGAVVDLAVIAVPPDRVAEVLFRLQSDGAAMAYTDLASVKSLPIDQAEQLRCDMTSFVAGHPLAGREKSGPMSAQAELFLGRPWAYCPTEESSPEAVDALLELIELCGADPVKTGAVEHDRAVALVSHAPHVVASAMAARLSEAKSTTLRLAGPGLRDMTRIAAGDPQLWIKILAGNASAVADVLESVAYDISSAAQELRRGTGDLACATDLLARGVTGTAKIPSKHGGVSGLPATIRVVISDQPGQLAQLFALAQETGVNIEDVRLDHASGLPLGFAELLVQPAATTALVDALITHGWTLRGVSDAAQRTPAPF